MPTRVTSTADRNLKDQIGESQPTMPNEASALEGIHSMASRSNPIQLKEVPIRTSRDPVGGYPLRDRELFSAAPASSVRREVPALAAAPRNPFRAHTLPY